MVTLPFTKIRNVILIIGAVVLIGGIGYRLGEKHATTIIQQPATVVGIEAPDSVRVDFSLFWDVWQRIHTFYIDRSSIDTQKLVWGAISGMVNALDDPYTVFLPPKENESFKEDIGGSFQGIGAQLGLKDGKIIIQTPLKGSPAEKMGLKPMDWILKVDSEDTVGWTLTQAVTKIRGTKGTPVTLSILHDKADKPIDITITRDDIVVPSVESWIKLPKDITEIVGVPGVSRILGTNKRIAYIYLSRFGDRTNEEWLKAVATIVEAERTGVDGLVFDLRNNPGGYLDGAVFIASEFIKSGTIVTQTNSDGTKETLAVNRKGQLTTIPMVVLINKGSASAAEIVAGALKDYKRATIVGETSFGKGSVQSPQELKGGAGVHITTGKWLLPNGDWINKKGITPDVEVKMDTFEATQDAQLAKAIELLLQ
jgi:carboxyl-terminal processing protease